MTTIRLDPISLKWAEAMHGRMFGYAWPHIPFNPRRLRAARKALAPDEDYSLLLYWEQGVSGAQCSRRSGGCQPAKVLRKLKERIVKGYSKNAWRRLIAASK